MLSDFFYFIGVPSDLKGENTVCCGKVAMDSEKELCCGQSPVPRPSKAFDKCCGSYAYNPNTETCCRGELFKKLSLLKVSFDLIPTMVETF